MKLQTLEGCIHRCIKIDKAPKSAVLKLMYCKIKIPKTANTVAIVAATILLILPLGKAGFEFLSSKSLYFFN